MMGASKTWHVPVRGRFSFKPSERQKPARGGGGFIERPMVQGDAVGEQILEKGSCYTCGSNSYHLIGCPRSY
jgi:hypothetical protein